MALEKRPQSPLPETFKPANGKPYKVKDGDSWDSVAKANGLKVWDLIVYNFQTTDPREVNWYLNKRVGCKLPTANGRNWRFSSSASPGMIYVPPAIATTLPTTLAPVIKKPNQPTQPPYLSKVWAGIGKVHSGDLFVVGAHDTLAKLYNLGDDWGKVRYAWVNIHGYKFGVGLGASIGLNLVVAYGFDGAGAMKGVDGDKDFDLAFGWKFGDYLKGLKTVGKIVNTLEKYQKVRYSVENLYKNRNFPKTGFYNLPIPFTGWGMHAWGGFKFGDVDLITTGTEIHSVEFMPTPSDPMFSSANSFQYK
jgi:hypothetical protein